MSVYRTIGPLVHCGCEIAIKHPDCLMRPVHTNYFNYTDTSINSLEVDSLSDSIIQYRIYTTLYIKIGHLDNFFLT